MFDISDITNFSCVCSLFVLLSTEEESGKYFAVANLAGKDLQLGEMMGIENLPLICKNISARILKLPDTKCSVW